MPYFSEVEANIAKANAEWDKVGHRASSQKIFETFGVVALQSWEGAELLIDAYLDLLESTGEEPSQKDITSEVYLRIKSYWDPNLSGIQLQKLDRFLALCKQA